MVHPSSACYVDEGKERETSRASGPSGIWSQQVLDVAEGPMTCTQARSAQGVAEAPQHMALTAAPGAQTHLRRSTGDPRLTRARQRRCLWTLPQKPGSRLMLIVCLIKVRD